MTEIIMPDRNTDQKSDNDDDKQAIGGQQSHRSEYGDQDGQEMSQEGREGSFGGESRGGGMAGQPIGGNDSNTGSGTTLTSGYTPPRDDEFGRDTTSNAGGSVVGKDQTSGGSSGVSGGEGFIGSNASGSDDQIEDRDEEEDSR
jgi:hypothetical protein